MDKKIMKVAGYLLENHCKYTESEIMNNLGITKKDFDRFTIAFAPVYATSVDKKWHLTFQGAQRYYDLRNRSQQEFFNKVLSIATVVLAVFSVVQTLKLYNII